MAAGRSLTGWNRSRQTAYAMRPLRLWHRVGPPTWKRSGTLVFAAVMGVLLIGGAAMAANLGLLTSTAPRDRGYRLDVPRPALSVTLPTTESSPPTVESTSVSEGSEEGDGDLDDDGDDSPTTERSNAGDSEDADDESGDGAKSESDHDDDDDADDDDGVDRSDDARSTSQREGRDPDKARSKSEERDGNAGGGLFSGDGRLDDD